MRKLRLVGKDIDVVVAAATGSTLEAAVNPVFMQHGITTRRVAVYCDGLLLSYLSTLAELGVEDEDQLDVAGWPMWHWMGNQPLSGPLVPDVAAPVLLQPDLLRRIIEFVGLPFMRAGPLVCRVWASAAALSLQAWHVALEGTVDWIKHPPDSASDEWQAIKQREQARFDQRASEAIEHGLEDYGEAIFEAPAFDWTNDPLRGAPRRMVWSLTALPTGQLAVLQERLVQHDEVGVDGVDVLLLRPRHASAASTGWKPTRGRDCGRGQDEGPKLAMDLALCRKVTVLAPMASASARVLVSDGDFLYVSWAPRVLHVRAPDSIVKYSLSDGRAVCESGPLSVEQNRRQPAPVSIKRMLTVGQWILCLASTCEGPQDLAGLADRRPHRAKLLLLRRDTLEREGHVMPLPAGFDPVDLAIANNRLYVIGQAVPNDRSTGQSGDARTSFILIYQLHNSHAADENLSMWRFLEPVDLDREGQRFRNHGGALLAARYLNPDGRAAAPQQQILFDSPLPSVYHELVPSPPKLSRIAFHRGRMLLVSDPGYCATLYVCTCDAAVLHSTSIEGPGNECEAVSLCADSDHIFALSTFTYPFGSGSEESRTCLGVYSVRGACSAQLAHGSPPCMWAAHVRAKYARFPECRAESTEHGTLNDGSVVARGYCKCRSCVPRVLPGTCACAACGFRSSTSQYWPFSLQGMGVEVDVDEAMGVRLGRMGWA
jgi:hypothetical protein